MAAAFNAQRAINADTAGVYENKTRKALSELRLEMVHV